MVEANSNNNNNYLLLLLLLFLPSTIHVYNQSLFRIIPIRCIDSSCRDEEFKSEEISLLLISINERDRVLWWLLAPPVSSPIKLLELICMAAGSVNERVVLICDEDDDNEYDNSFCGERLTRKLQASLWFIMKMKLSFASIQKNEDDRPNYDQPKWF